MDLIYGISTRDREHSYTAAHAPLLLRVRQRIQGFTKTLHTTDVVYPALVCRMCR